MKTYICFVVLFVILFANKIGISNSETSIGSVFDSAPEQKIIWTAVIKSTHDTIQVIDVNDYFKSGMTGQAVQTFVNGENPGEWEIGFFSDKFPKDTTIFYPSQQSPFDLSAPRARIVKYREVIVL